jgi:hypothetical protein
MNDQENIVEIVPFQSLPFFEYFEHDLEKIMSAFRLSNSIRIGLKNTRAAGDEVELAIKKFYSSKLFPRYHVCDGHIVDNSLKVSPQYDIIITEKSKNPTLFDLSDKSEIIYYETVYLFGEVKRSFYNKDLIKKFVANIQRFRKEMVRDKIDPHFIEAGSGGIYTENKLTDLPLRNPILTFMFFVDSSKFNVSNFKEVQSAFGDENMPNFIVLLNSGIIINVDSEEYDNGNIKINLYPEFNTKDSKWVLLSFEGDDHKTLSYHYMLILEHLNSTVLSSPDLKKYTSKLFNFSLTNFIEL